MAELRARPLYSYRNDPAVPHLDDRGPIAIMDGDCALCAGGARAIARFDRARRFRIGRTQSPLGGALVRHYRSGSASRSAREPNGHLCERVPITLAEFGHAEGCAMELREGGL